MDASSYSDFPLVDKKISAELFSPQIDKDLQCEIWHGIRGSLTEDIQRLRAASADELGQSLHKIFGYSSNAALLRLGVILKTWVETPQPHESTVDFLPLALETAVLSIAEMEALFPHLSGNSPILKNEEI